MCDGNRKYIVSLLSLIFALPRCGFSSQLEASGEYQSPESEFIIWAEKLMIESSKTRIEELEKNMHAELKERKCSKPSDSESEQQSYDYPKLMGFVSFAMPIDALLDLSTQLKKVGGAFVIRGLPENSFKLLAEKIVELRKKGANVPILIDPKAFELHNVQHVPTFVLYNGDKCDKIAGNISVESALTIFAEKGDVEESKELLRLYRGR